MSELIDTKPVGLIIPDFQIAAIREWGCSYLYFPLNPQPHFPTVAADEQESIYCVSPTQDGRLRYRSNGDGDSIRYDPVYLPGAVLAIREAYALGETLDGSSSHRKRYYRADGVTHTSGGLPLRWRSPVEMPLDECRLRLKITASAVVRVQDIKLSPEMSQRFSLEQYRNEWNKIYAPWRSRTKTIQGKKQVYGYISFPWGQVDTPQVRRCSRNVPFSAYPNPWAWQLKIKAI